MKGYCEIGIYHGKTSMNIGTLWRSAYQLGACGIYTIGKRYPRQGSDTLNTRKHVPLREFLSLEQWHQALPLEALVVGIEMHGKPLTGFTHPERAIYILGAEDSGLDEKALAYCHHIVSIEAVRTASYNVAIAGSLVLYDRYCKQRKMYGPSIHESGI